MVLLKCRKCSHTVEFEGSAPERVRCPGCGSMLESSRDSVEPSAETALVNAPPLQPEGCGPGATTIYLPPKAADRGDMFGNYKILDEIARGAMGIVYRAKQTSLNRIVALKLLMAGESASQDQIERFYRESQAVAKLRHPNIVPIYDMGKVENQHYFTMEYVEGKALDDIIPRDGMPENHALDIIEQVGKALRHAHQQGIVHRDVKPGNILIGPDGHVQVMDFGLAKEVNTGRRMTHSGVTVGTPNYMSPEQARGASRKVDARTDVYSMGAVLYELLTGRPPHDGDTPVDVVLKVVQEEPLKPRKIKPKISRDLETIIMKALEKDLGRRYRDVEQFLADIERYRANEPIEARPSTLLYSVRKKINKHKDLSMVISAAVIVLCVVFILLEHRAIQAEKKLTSLREEHQLAAERESTLRKEKEQEEARRQKWKEVYNEPFSGSNMARWIKKGGKWEPIDTFLTGTATGDSSFELKENLCGNVRIFMYFMLGSPLKGHFGAGLSSASEAAGGYEFLFTPEGMKLFKNGRLKKHASARLDENRQYELLFLRENDVLTIRLDGRELVNFRDLDPITGADGSRFRFLLSEGKVYIDDLKIELESTPLVGSPLIMADKLFMEGLYQPAIEVYRKVAEMPPDAAIAAEALYKMGLAYEKQENMQEAVECFKQVSALYENSVHAYPSRLHLGLVLLSEREYDSLEKLVDDSGGEPFLRELLAEANPDVLTFYVSQLKLPGDLLDPNVEIAALKKYIVLNEMVPEKQRDDHKLAKASLRLCEVLYERESFEEASDICEKIFTTVSADSSEEAFEARFLFGKIKSEVGDYSAAAEAYEEWLKLYPVETFAKKAAGNVMRSEGRIVRVFVGRLGRSFWENYVGKYVRVQRNLMEAYIELGRIDDSIVLAESTISDIAKGREGETLETYMLSRMERHFHQEQWARFWKGTLFVMRGLYREAVAELDESYRVPLADAEPPRMMPGATEEERRAVMRQVERAFGTDEEIAEHNTRVNIMRYVAYLKLGNRAEALKHLGSSLAENPDYFGPATPLVAEIFTREVLPDELPETVPKNEKVYCYITGVSLFSADKKDKARSFLLRATAARNVWTYNIARTELALLDAGGNF